jgi:hypothetical protein
MSEERVPLGLTAAQVARVLEAAGAGGEADAGAFSGLAKPEELVRSSLLEDHRVSRSLLLGLVVLIGFPADGSERGVTAIARELDLPSSTTHRYIHTLLTVGLLEQDPVTRKYRRAHPSGRSGQARGSSG